MAVFILSLTACDTTNRSDTKQLIAQAAVEQTTISDTTEITPTQNISPKNNNQ